MLYHDQDEFISDVQGWLNIIRKSLRVIHHIKKLQENKKNLQEDLTMPLNMFNMHNFMNICIC